MNRIAVVLALVAACESPQAQPDGGRRDGYVSPCGPKPAGMLCTETCGNGVVEDCLTYGLYGEECLVYSWKHETCDGDTMPCTTLGYYGGTATCYTSCNGFSTAACEVCPPDAELCAPLSYISFATGLAPNTIATSGTGVIDVYDLQGSAPVEAAELAVPTNNARALTAVPGGWIVVSSTLDANFVSDSGVVGPTTLISRDGGLIVDAIYAANRVFVVWSAPYDGVHVAVLDTSGALVAGPVQAHPNVTSSTDVFSVATDGTALFVADHNRLAKVLADGTIATSTTFAFDPIFESHVTCDGTTCWFLHQQYVAQAPGLTAQRFDANATLMGTPITIPPELYLFSFLADGSDLLGLSVDALPLRLVRFDATGSMVATKTVGAGRGGTLFHVGARIGVLFGDHIAVVTPP